ncbi:MAG: hypothetical protein KDD44_09650, partial [Bdellovibrionales bacterium]|nr:hypothetical protein [Bdellovibrionales bacterium]
TWLRTLVGHPVGETLRLELPTEEVAKDKQLKDKVPKGEPAYVDVSILKASKFDPSNPGKLEPDPWI